MNWDPDAESILPENEDGFDTDALAAALESESTRRFADAFAATPRWLDDVA